MNSYERTMTALSHKIPDKVPVFLFLTLHGAKALSMPIREYFSKAENVAKGQLMLSNRFGHDCLYPFFYASREVEAFNGTTLFYENGSPNAGAPIINSPNDIDSLEIPNPFESEALKEPLKTIHLLAKEKKGNIPIISAMIAPFSLPSMLMGLEKWLDILLFGEKASRDKFLDELQKFSIDWANAQFEAGVDAIGFFDPLSTAEVMTREQYIKYAFQLASNTIKKIKGPIVYAGAGGKFGHIVDLIKDTGAFGIVLSSNDDLALVKKQVGEKLNIVGNLNNIEMSSWTPEKTEQEVKKCIQAGAENGGYILADQHGEIPYCVNENILHNIVDSARKFGTYE